MTADQTIIDCIAELRKINAAVGQHTVNEDITTDLDGLKTMNIYLGLMVVPFGGAPVLNSEITDELSAISAICRNAAMIARAVS
jgi:hypothetical protein